MDNLFEHISDTALWIAGYRAQETERPDATFKDPLAAKLAGDRGRQMVAITPKTHLMAFAMVARTTGIDKLVYSAIKQGVDTVINLGAGLDTRPYRLDLPVGLKWIEVDFPRLINYKNEKLAGDNPICQLQRIATDLSIDEERRKLLNDLAAQTTKALIITEGVVSYLTSEQAAQLSKDLFAHPQFALWIQDFKQGKYRNNSYHQKLNEMLKRTPLQFQEPDPLGFFGKQGWKVAEKIFMLDQSDSIGRPAPMTFPLNILSKLFPQAIRKGANETYGYVMFGR